MTYDQLSDWMRILTAVIGGVAFIALIITTWVTIKANKDKEVKNNEQKERIEKLRNDTANLEKEVADAKLRQAEAELALAEMQERLRQRNLTPEQKTQLSLKLKQCSVSEIDVVYGPNNLEAENFAKQIRSLLSEAGWEGELIMSSPFPYNMKGLAIETNSPENSIGMCLHRAMWESGLEAPGVITPGFPADKLYLIVGEKP